MQTMTAVAKKMDISRKTSVDFRLSWKWNEGVRYGEDKLVTWTLESPAFREPYTGCDVAVLFRAARLYLDSQYRGENRFAVVLTQTLKFPLFLIVDANEALEKHFPGSQTELVEEKP